MTLRVAIASDAWKGRRSRSPYTYAAGVLAAARKAGVDARPYPLADYSEARVGGLVVPFVRALMVPYRVEEGTLVHQAGRAASPGVDVTTVFDLTMYHMRGSFALTLRRSMTRLSIKRAKRVIALTEARAQEIAHAFPEHRDKLRAVPIPFATPPPGRLPPAYDATWVGFTWARKNPVLYLRLAARFPGRRFAMRVADSSGLSGAPPNVTFLPEMSEEELDRMYRSSGVLVVTSSYEGFHAPAMEAYLRGTKLLLPRSDVFTEIYGEKDGCANVTWYDPPWENGTEEAFARAFESACAEAAREPDARIVGSVSLESVGERLRAVYEEAQ